jgi:uncharacterized membrane protein (UPF0136 family)
VTVRLTTLSTILIVAACSTVWLPLAVPIGGLNLRASQIVLLPILAILLRNATGRVTALGAAQALCAVAFVVVLLFWTIWWHDVLPRLSPGRVALHVLNLLHLAAMQVILWRTRAVRQAVMTFIVTVACFDAFYVVVALLASAGISLPLPILVTVTQPALVGGEIVAQTIQRFEGGGITAGCLSAACLLMVLAMVMDAPERRPKRWLLLSALLTAGLVLGYSRQSLVGLVLGAFVIGVGFLVRGQLHKTIRMAVRLTVAFVVAGVLLAAIPATRTYLEAFAGRASQLLSGDAYSSGTAAERMEMWSAMWGEVKQNPMVGRGQDAYLRYYPPSDPLTNEGPGGGAHNLPIEVWHAGGLLALLAMAGLHFLLFWPVARGLMAAPREHLCFLVALAAGGTAVAAATLTNLIYWNPTYWVFLAMVSAARVVPFAPAAAAEDEPPPAIG